VEQLEQLGQELEVTLEHALEHVLELELTVKIPEQPLALGLVLGVWRYSQGP
jgi:hypothetical protein